MEKNLSIKQLAHASGITPESLSNVERDKQAPSLSTIRKMSDELQVPISYIGEFESLPEKALSQRITKARMYHGLTKKEFSNQIGIDVKTLRGWESGLHVPLSKYVSTLSKYLQVLNHN